MWSKLSRIYKQIWNQVHNLWKSENACALQCLSKIPSRHKERLLPQTDEHPTIKIGAAQQNG